MAWHRIAAARTQPTRPHTITIDKHRNEKNLVMMLMVGSVKFLILNVMHMGDNTDPVAHGWLIDPNGGLIATTWFNLAQHGSAISICYV